MTVIPAIKLRYADRTLKNRRFPGYGCASGGFRFVKGIAELERNEKVMLSSEGLMSNSYNIPVEYGLESPEQPNPTLLEPDMGSQQIVAEKSGI